MPNFKEPIFDFTKLDDKAVTEILAKNSLGLTVDEARKIQKILNRAPRLTELTLFSIAGSEHCSYRSSRKYLKNLPTKAKQILVGVGEDAGIVEFARSKNGKEKFGLIMGHESHNHPSQIVPYEGAATGVGGIVRDILCMGGRVIGVLDILRFGDIQKPLTKLLASEVTAGIAGYGNPIGVPNLGGTIYFDSSYDDNCLVNVVALGLIKEDEIIHSYVPEEAVKEKYDIILVGKPTDRSGFGGAAFASIQLNEEESEKNRGAVQEPNPFLKRHLLASFYALFDILKKKKLLNKVALKDLGAGGISGASAELIAKRGYGAEIDLKKIPVALKNLPPQVIACAETQERMCWMVHPKLTKMILDHYNKTWALPKVSEGARAAVIGKVTKGNYVLKFGNEIVFDVASQTLTEGLSYDRLIKDPKRKFTEPKIKWGADQIQITDSKNKTTTHSCEKIFLQLISSPNLASQAKFYEQYDKQIQGMTVIERDQATASVIAPLRNMNVPKECREIGIAIATDTPTGYGAISPYWQAANAVISAMRNIASVGATPLALTDCLNYGNPEKPEQMWELVEGIRGLVDATKIEQINIPFISGNVSLYNESRRQSILPTASICCAGKIKNYQKAITSQLKSADSILVLVGERKDELGGSQLYHQFGLTGKNIPQINFAETQKEIFALVEAIDQSLIRACQPISAGGLAYAISRMTLSHPRTLNKSIGVILDLAKINQTKTLQPTQKLFSETGGFLLEIAPEKSLLVEKIFAKQKIKIYPCGKTTQEQKIVITNGGKEIVNCKW